MLQNPSKGLMSTRASELRSQNVIFHPFAQNELSPNLACRVAPLI